MKLHKIILGAGVLAGVALYSATALAAAAGAQPLALQAAAAGDQVPVTLMATPPTTLDVERAPVHISWALPAGETLQSQPQPFTRVSRHYQVDADGAALARGVTLPLTSAGAVLRISPATRDSAPLHAGQLHLRNSGQRLPAARVASIIASGDEMNAAGLAMRSGSLALRLGEQVAGGPVIVDARGATGKYLIQVDEPDSAYALTLAAARDTQLAGQRLEVRAALRQPGTTASLDAIDGLLEAPDGWTMPITFMPRPDRSYVATIEAPAAHAGAQRGLWQVHAFASGQDDGRELLRDATNAFAIVVPTARLDGRIDAPATARSGLAFAVGVETASASRYAVSGVLHGHDATGQLRPAAYAESAVWLEAGVGQEITLRFDAAALAESGLFAPWALHDLRLVDQVQLGVLERRQVALRNIAAPR